MLGKITSQSLSPSKRNACNPIALLSVLQWDVPRKNSTEAIAEVTFPENGSHIRDSQFSSRYENGHKSLINPEVFA